jgi:hypothetical protein
VTDGIGQSATATQRVVVRDTTAPTLTCTTNVSVAAPASVRVDYAAAIASDGCGSVAVSSDPPSGSQFPVGTTPVQVTATDASGNTSACSFAVTVTASVDPVSALIDRINALVASGTLNKGQGNSLLVKIRAKQFGAFINEVNALVKASILPPAVGQTLIDMATALLSK